MPIYEYRCSECGHELEALQGLSEAKLTDCPECGAEALKRLVSAVGFRLKGGGWYETDFKSGNRRNVVEGGNGAAAGASDSGSNGSGNGGDGKAADSKSDSGGKASGDGKAAASKSSGSEKSGSSTAQAN